MGYRHQVISDTLAPSKDSLPAWFIEKYENFIDFDGGFWVSRTEYKRYGVLSDFEEDIQKMLVESASGEEIRLVYFADESDSDYPDISHVAITKDSIIEILPSGWMQGID